MARRIEIWPTDRLVPYARNARTHSAEQIAQIAASILEFGFTNPILVDSMDGIIAGHGRLLAARKLGLAEERNLLEREKLPGWTGSGST
jgi:ParB-like chromosome segregation protein Spo0J